MFSVITPLYNKAAYVEKALQSLINQTFTEFEIIVIDDGSTDNSLNIVKQIIKSSNHQINIIEQKNSGVSTARNNGVNTANYDYICFLDADDWWQPTFLAEMKRLIDDFPDAGIYGTGYFKVKDCKNIPAKIGVPANFERGYFDYFQAYTDSMWMPLWTGAVCVPRNIFNEFKGFNSSLRMGEDFHLWARIALKYKTVLLNKPLAFYNQDVEQASRAAGRKLHKPENHFLFAAADLFEQEKDNPKLKQLLDNLRVYGLYAYFLNKKTRQDAKNQLDKINWTKQSAKDFNRYYKTPVWWQKAVITLKIILLNMRNNL